MGVRQIYHLFRNNVELSDNSTLRPVDGRACSFARLRAVGLKVARRVRTQCQGSIFTTDIDTGNLSRAPGNRNESARSRLQRYI